MVWCVGCLVCFGFGGFCCFPAVWSVRLVCVYCWYRCSGFCGFLVRVVCFEFLAAFGFMILVVWCCLLGCLLVCAYGCLIAAGVGCFVWFVVVFVVF